MWEKKKKKWEKTIILFWISWLEKKKKHLESLINEEKTLIWVL